MTNTRRKDIDVLRALAVIPVIIFHFKKELFPLGYLGVDIFFVISGYLIAKIILKDFINNSFSFFDFYTRRIKRILPAFLLVITVSLFFALGIFFINDVKNFLQSVISSLFFVPNFYFWITGGYFGSNDELKPLLHLWSLGIEIQFYMLFPIFFFILYKKTFNLKKITIFIILISLISFLLNVFFIYKGHKDILFFLFPFRIWEFGLGILTAFFQIKNKNNIFFEKYRTSIGLIFIIFNYFFKFDYFPDSLFICIGTALLLFKENIYKNFFNKIFNSSTLIFVGLISYSLYLWHWPVASYLKYISVDKLSNTYIFFGILLTLILSFFSWKYVEKPFLENKKISTSVFKYVFTTYSFLILSSFLIITDKTFPSFHDKYLNKLSAQTSTTYHCSLLNSHFYGDSIGCLMNESAKKDYTVGIFGNSHAAMYGWGIKKQLSKDNSQALLLHLNHCLPLIDANTSSMCLRKANNYFDSIIRDTKIKKVIIGLTWYSQVTVDKDNKLLKDPDFYHRNISLVNLIDKLRESKKEVYLIGPLSIPNFDISSQARKITFGKEKKLNLSIPKNIFLEKNFKSIDLFTKKLGSKFLRPDKILCNKKECFFGDSKGFFFSDSTHLGKYGSIETSKLFDTIGF